MHTSRQFCGIILGGRHRFRSERGHGVITSVVFTQARGRGDQGGHMSSLGSNLPQVDPVPRIDVTLYRCTE